MGKRKVLSKDFCFHKVHFSHVHFCWWVLKNTSATVLRWFASDTAHTAFYWVLSRVSPNMGIGGNWGRISPWVKKLTCLPCPFSYFSPNDFVIFMQFLSISAKMFPPTVDPNGKPGDLWIKFLLCRFPVILSSSSLKEWRKKKRKEKEKEKKKKKATKWNGEKCISLFSVLNVYVSMCDTL